MTNPPVVLQGLPAGNPAFSDDNLTIQKSLPMLSLWRSPMTLAEFKILDIYLSRIDSRQPEKRWVRFDKGELERVLGVKYIKPAELKKRLRNLCTVIELPNPDIPDAFSAISLFERASCVPDEYGVWVVDLMCTPSAMKYIFNIENIGYLRYTLRSICQLTSRYTYILFLYLEQNRFRGTWTEDIDILRNMLGCDSEYYQSYKRFNQRILSQCRMELAEKTECLFSYVPVKRGRTVRKIQFTMLSPAPSENELPFDAVAEIPPDLPAERSSEDDIELQNGLVGLLNFLQSACCPPGTGKPLFSLAQTNRLLQLIRLIPPNSLPQWTPGGDLKTAMYHYLAERFAVMWQYNEKKKIRNPLSYLCRMIEQDIPGN